MKRRQFMIAAATVAAALWAGAAAAAELLLFEDPGFGGAQLVLRGYTPNLGHYGFDRRVQSVVVQSGRWQLCTEPDFRGNCTELVPGQYGRLDASIDRRIASAREVGSYGRSTGGYRDYGRGIIKFFSRTGFDGRSLDLQADAPVLGDRGFDDSASSVIVSEGVWELCTDPNYSGQCRQYGPGRYADLGWGMSRQVSSARVVRNPNDAPAWMGGGWGQVPPNEQGTSRLILFREEGLRGPSMALSSSVVNFQDVRFNDAAASMVVEGGPWLACSDAAFRGNCRVFAPGRYDQLRDAGLSRVISSARPVAAEAVAQRPVPAPVPTPAPAPPAGPPRPDGTNAIQLFSERGFRGETRSFGSEVSNLNIAAFNKRARSMVVHGGEWELCSDEGFQGRCIVAGPGSYADIGGLSDGLTSLRRVR